MYLLSGVRYMYFGLYDNYNNKKIDCRIITFNTTILSAYVLANSSNFGAITLHGPHQVAKKSTMIKRPAAAASSSWALKSSCKKKGGCD